MIIIVITEKKKTKTAVCKDKKMKHSNSIAQNNP